MTPIPYANPIGHIDGIIDDGGSFDIANGSDSLGPDVGVTVLRHSAEADALTMGRGSVTAVENARASFRLNEP